MSSTLNLHYNYFCFWTARSCCPFLPLSFSKIVSDKNLLWSSAVLDWTKFHEVKYLPFYLFLRHIPQRKWLKSSFHWLLYFFLPTNISTYPNRKRIIIRQQNQSMYVGRPVYKIMNYEFIRGRCSIQKRLGKIFAKIFLWAFQFLWRHIFSELGLEDVSNLTIVKRKYLIMSARKSTLLLQ